MLIENLHTKRAEINALVVRYGASRVRVFGSVARGDEQPESDVDFLVDFPKGYDLFTQRIPLMNSLSELIGRKVDLIPEHELNAHIKQQVLREAKDL